MTHMSNGRQDKMCVCVCVCGGGGGGGGGRYGNLFSLIYYIYQYVRSYL